MLHTLIFLSGKTLQVFWNCDQWIEFYFDTMTMPRVQSRQEGDNVIFSLDGIDMLLVNFG